MCTPLQRCHRRLKYITYAYYIYTFTTRTRISDTVDQTKDTIIAEMMIQRSARYMSYNNMLLSHVFVCFFLCITVNLYSSGLFCKKGWWCRRSGPSRYLKIYYNLLHLNFQHTLHNFSKRQIKFLNNAHFQIMPMQLYDYVFFLEFFFFWICSHCYALMTIGYKLLLYIIVQDRWNYGFNNHNIIVYTFAELVIFLINIMPICLLIQI